MLCAVVAWASLLLRAANWPLWWLPLAVTVGFFWLLGVSSAGVRIRRSGWSIAWLCLPLLFAGIRAWSSTSPKSASSINWLGSIGQPIRDVVRTAVVGITPSARGLVLGITDGDTTLLAKSLQQQFKELSLTHLTAVSGTNCAILIGGLTILSSQMGWRRHVRIVVPLTALVLYLMLVGDQPSVIRAAIMSSVVVFSLGIGARFKSIHVLSFAVLATLCCFPSFATDLGFQLSVLATAGVLFVAPRLSARFAVYLPKPIALALAIAIAAQVLCLPILISLQSSQNVGSLLANVVAEPAVVPATLLGLLGVLVVVSPLGQLHWIAQSLFFLASIPAAFIVTIGQWLLLRWPNVPLPSGALGQIWSLAVLIAVLMWVSERSWLRGLSSLLAMLSVVLLALQLIPRLPSGVFAPPGWLMVACDVGQGDATVLSAGGQVAVIDVGKDDLPIDKCLTRLRINRINLLVLTHFDLDHVGGVSGAIKNREVDSALLTQYVDSRPGAVAVERLLQHQKVPIRRVAMGDHGILGNPKLAESMSWLVLTPHPNGTDSISSNDGSVAMFWHSRFASVFTMADLPATGQMRVLAEKSMWWSNEFRKEPVILKVSHHGSADQNPEFLSWVHPLVSTISVGVGNPYGHPTEKALNWLRQDSQLTLRTDKLGSISITPNRRGGLTWANTGGG